VSKKHGLIGLKLDFSVLEVLFQFMHLISIVYDSILKFLLLIMHEMLQVMILFVGALNTNQFFLWDLAHDFRYLL